MPLFVNQRKSQPEKYTHRLVEGSIHFSCLHTPHWSTFNCRKTYGNVWLRENMCIGLPVNDFYEFLCLVTSHNQHIEIIPPLWFCAYISKLEKSSSSLSPSSSQLSLPLPSVPFFLCVLLKYYSENILTIAENREERKRGGVCGGEFCSCNSGVTGGGI